MACEAHVSIFKCYSNIIDLGLQCLLKAYYGIQFSTLLSIFKTDNSVQGHTGLELGPALGEKRALNIHLYPINIPTGHQSIMGMSVLLF